ncbi:hypothetical protein SAMN05216328_15523, partial [Ensifer sp. YR511]
MADSFRFSSVQFISAWPWLSRGRFFLLIRATGPAWIFRRRLRRCRRNRPTSHFGFFRSEQGNGSSGSFIFGDCHNAFPPCLATPAGCRSARADSALSRLIVDCRDRGSTDPRSEAATARGWGQAEFEQAPDFHPAVQRIAVRPASHIRLPYPPYPGPNAFCPQSSGHILPGRRSERRSCGSGHPQRIRPIVFVAAPSRFAQDRDARMRGHCRILPCPPYPGRNAFRSQSSGHIL